MNRWRRSSPAALEALESTADGERVWLATAVRPCPTRPGPTRPSSTRASRGWPLPGLVTVMRVARHNLTPVLMPRAGIQCQKPTKTKRSSNSTRDTQLRPIPAHLKNKPSFNSFQYYQSPLIPSNSSDLFSVRKSWGEPDQGRDFDDLGQKIKVL